MDPGLLECLDELIVKQHTNECLRPVAIGTANHYYIRDKCGKELLTAKEYSTDRCRSLCGSLRDYEVIVKNKYHEKIARFAREYKPCACNCQCCMFCNCTKSIVSVECPIDNIVGNIQQQCHIFREKLVIESYDFCLPVYVKGGVCGCCWWMTLADFEVYTGDREFLGNISRFCNRLENSFRVTFPACLKVDMKLSLLAAGFLLSFTHWENNYHRNYLNATVPVSLFKRTCEDDEPYDEMNMNYFCPKDPSRVRDKVMLFADDKKCLEERRKSPKKKKKKQNKR